MVTRRRRRRPPPAPGRAVRRRPAAGRRTASADRSSRLDVRPEGRVRTPGASLARRPGATCARGGRTRWGRARRGYPTRTAPAGATRTGAGKSRPARTAPRGRCSAEHDVGEPARVVGTEQRLARRAETRQIGCMHAVPAAQRRRRLEQRGASASQSMKQQHVGAATHRQRRDPVRSDRDVVDLEQRRATADEPEHPLERHRVVQVSVDRQQTLLERLDARELSLTKAHPGV